MFGIAFAGTGMDKKSKVVDNLKEVLKLREKSRNGVKKVETPDESFKAKEKNKTNNELKLGKK